MARGAATVLAVGVSRTIIPGMIVSPLPMVSNEIMAIRETILAKSLVVLENDQATVANILKAVPDCSALHLACHAYQDLVNPLSSAFLVHGEKLYLSRLIQESLSKAELAFLSACQTARGKTFIYSFLWPRAESLNQGTKTHRMRPSISPAPCFLLDFVP